MERRQFARSRPRYENNIKVDFVAIGDDVTWTHFKMDIENCGILRPRK